MEAVGATEKIIGMYVSNRPPLLFKTGYVYVAQTVSGIRLFKGIVSVRSCQTDAVALEINQL